MVTLKSCDSYNAFFAPVVRAVAPRFEAARARYNWCEVPGALFRREPCRCYSK